MLIRGGTLGLLLIVGSLNAFGAALSGPELEQLRQARELAARVYSTTGDAEGAAKVLVEAGVEVLLEQPPGTMARERYLQIVEDYAGYLARIEGRGHQAAGLLKTVIQADPARPSAYLSLGELYYRRFRQTGDAQHRRIYTGAYQKYVELLREQDQSRLLQTHVVKTVFAGVDDVCALAGELAASRRLDDLQRFFNPETAVNYLERDAQAIRSLADAAVSFAGFVKSSEGAIRVAEVDIDNDGALERRYTVETRSCRRNVFYKRLGGQTVLFSNGLLDRYFPPERICDDNRLFPVRYAGTNYLFEARAGASGGERYEIFELRPSGAYNTLCRAGPIGALKQNLVNDCDAPVCRHLAANIERIVDAEGRVGDETPLVEGRELAFAGDGMQLVLDSPHKHRADVNNDGRAELIVRLWRGQSGGATRYSHRLFEQREGVWAPWQWPVDIPADRWFFIEAYEGVNYVVGYRVLQQSDGVRRYELDVYHLRDQQAERLGGLHTRQAFNNDDSTAEAGIP